MKDKDIKRFWSKVLHCASDCWEWQGGRVNPKGKHPYGYFITHSGGKPSKYLAHRFVWQLTNGPIPEGMFVCHKCDNPPCVNPAHLFLGTNSDNVQDMLAKGRGATGERNGSYTHPERKRRGENHPAGKLTAETVQSIRGRLSAKTASQSEIAAEYGVSQQTVSEAARGLTWRHVGGPVVTPDDHNRASANTRHAWRCECGEVVRGNIGRVVHAIKHKNRGVDSVSFEHAV